MALALLYRPLVLECVDPVFLRSVSRAGTPTHSIFLGLVVLNLVGGFQALGTLLAVGMMMLPAAAARFWSERHQGDDRCRRRHRHRSRAWADCSLSFHAALPAGPAIILSAGAAYVVSLLLGREGGVLVAGMAAPASRSLTLSRQDPMTMPTTKSRRRLYCAMPALAARALSSRRAACPKS